VNDTGNITQNRQEDVDEEIGIASTLEEHTERRDENGEDDLDDVASGERHDEGLVIAFLGIWVVVVSCSCNNRGIAVEKC